MPRKKAFSYNFYSNVLLLLLLSFSAPSIEAIFAQGNLAIVFNATSGRTSEHSPLQAELSELWCQATKNGVDRLPVKSAKFVQVNPPPTRVHKAEVLNDRAHLKFGKVSPSVAGKYKCEITTNTAPAEDFVTGNLFVYMRPILYTNGSLKVDQVEDGNPFLLSGTPNKVIRGETARLNCPAIGYPVPSVEWFRDGEKIVESTEKILIIGNQLHIREADDPDEGIYRCVASNSFPVEVDNPPEHFSIILDQHLRVSSSLSWLLPLILIFVMLLLLFLIIYSCAAWKRYRHAQYNVAQKERCLRKAEEQRLNEDADDEE